MIQSITILLGAILTYLVFVLIHHKRSKSLTLTTFLEYLLTAALAIVLLLGVLNP